MVVIVEGVVGAVVSGKGETSSIREVFIETSVLATREVRLVIMASGSRTSVGESGLVITIKPVVAEAESVAGMETSPLVNLS